MTLMIVANAVLDFTLLVVMLSLLGGAIHRNRTDQQPAIMDARRRQARERRRTAATVPHRQRGWAASASTDAL
jgi:hypothetical protein